MHTARWFRRALRLSLPDISIRVVHNTSEIFIETTFISRPTSYKHHRVLHLSLSLSLSRCSPALSGAQDAIAHHVNKTKSRFLHAFIFPPALSGAQDAIAHHVNKTKSRFLHAFIFPEQSATQQLGQCWCSEVR